MKQLVCYCFGYSEEDIIRDLEEQGLFQKDEKHAHAVGHCYRCETMIEPYLSEQWFVRMKPLAEPGIVCHLSLSRGYSDRPAR